MFALNFQLAVTDTLQSVQVPASCHPPPPQPGQYQRNALCRRASLLCIAETIWWCWASEVQAHSLQTPSPGQSMLSGGGHSQRAKQMHQALSVPVHEDVSMGRYAGVPMPEMEVGSSHPI